MVSMLPAAALGQTLRANGYAAAGLRALWGTVAAEALERHDPVPALRAIRDRDSALATLGSLFRLGATVPVRDAERVGLDVPALVGAGVLEPGNAVVPERPAAPRHEPAETSPSATHVRASYSITPIERAGGRDLLILADHDATTRPGRLPADHVLGVGGASRTLASITVRERVGDLLDLGTGCGIQALLAAPFAERVVATDISERALAIAAFNCALNGVENIELRAGSLFEPVAGERFDQIVSNPPFVITPRTNGVERFEYRDGGARGDDLVGEVFAGAAAHLRPGGRAQFLANWEYRADRPEPPRDWLPEGVDAWVIERQTSDPAEYAETWVRDGGYTPADPEYRRMIGAWLDDFDSRGVTSIGFGWVMLLAPEGAAAVPSVAARLEHVGTGPGDNPGGLGSHLALSAAVGQAMAILGDAEIAALHYRLAPDVTEERIGPPGHPDPTMIVMSQGAGLARRVRVDTVAAAFLGTCDGELSLAAIADALAHLLEVNPGELRAELCQRAREFSRIGILLPEFDGE